MAQPRQDPQVAAPSGKWPPRVRQRMVHSERVELSPRARTFLQASIRRDRTRRTRSTTVLAVLLVIALAAAGVAEILRRDSDRNQRLALARSLSPSKPNYCSQPIPDWRCGSAKPPYTLRPAWKPKPCWPTCSSTPPTGPHSTATPARWPRCSRQTGATSPPPTPAAAASRSCGIWPTRPTHSGNSLATPAR